LKPASFRYVAPTSLDEAIDILGSHGSDARLLAGGQSLMPVLNFRLGQPSLLIDLNRIADLAFVREDGDRVAIGAMTRQSAIETDPLVARHVPLLAEATGNIAHRAVRNRGTIGGSLVQADPAAEYPACMLALDATLVVRGRDGERRIAATDFFDGPLTTTLAEGEILVRIEVPKAPPGSGSAFIELARRHGDFALAGVAARIVLANGSVARASLAACGAGPGPVRLSGAEQALLGSRADEAAIQSAGRAAMREVEPESDLHASAAYRRRIAGVMTARAVARAVERAKA